MRNARGSTSPTGIELEIYDRIKEGCSLEERETTFLQDAARELFIERFPENGRLTVEGSRIAGGAFRGGLLAAEEVGLDAGEAATALARGVLSGICSTGGDFLTGSWMVVHSAILGALRTPSVLSKVAECSVGVVLAAGRERGGNMEHLTRTVVQAAVEAAGSHPEEDAAALERRLLGLLGGCMHADEKGFHWRGGRGCTPRQAAYTRA